MKRFLEYQERLGVLCFVRINVSPTLRGGTFSPNREMAGMPDFMVWLRGGPTICLEAKAPKGAQRPSQKAFEQKLQRVGHRYHLVRGTGEFLYLLASYGVKV
jgi:hypothetical protein